MSEEMRGSTATPDRGSGGPAGPGDGPGDGAQGGGGGGRGRGKSGRPGLFARIALFVRQVVAELRKVIWPTRRELITYTTVVVVFVAVMAAIVSLLDLLFTRGALWLFGS